MTVPKSKPSKDRFPLIIRNGSVSAKIYSLRRKFKRAGKVDERTVYSLAYVGIQGRRVRQFGILARAKAEGRLVVDQIAAGEVEGALMSKADRALLMGAKEIAGAMPLLTALSEWKQAKELVGPELLPACRAWAKRLTRVKSKLVPKVVKEFIDVKSRDHVNMDNSYRWVLEPFAKKFAAHSLDQIHVRELSEWLQQQKNPATRNTFRKRIVTLFRWARTLEYLPREMTTEAELTVSVEEPPPARALIEVEIYEKLIRGFEAERPDLIPAIVIAGFAGLRSVEVAAQIWEDINLEEGHLSVTAAKKGTTADRYVPLSPAAVAWLSLTPKAERHGIIHGYDTEVITIVRNYARRTLKLDLPRNTLRKSWISHRLAVTKDLAATSLEAGHSSQVEVRNYRGKVKEPEGHKWFRINPSQQRNRPICPGKK
jgi:integrase